MLSTTAGAAVTLTVEPRTELLYSTKDADCTALFHTASNALPFNVTRLRVLVDGIAPDPSVRLAWSFKGAAAGTFAADEDLGPKNDLPLVTAMCEEFGTCELTGSALTAYGKDTILYLAPKCEDLGRDPAKPFTGGKVKVLVRAFRGKRKLGKALTTLGFGHNGSTTLFVDGTDGIGRQTGVLTGVIADYSATLVPPAGVPGAPTSWSVTGPLGNFELSRGCPDARYAACDRVEQTGTRGIETLAATFDDDSALCDNIRVVVELCSPDATMDVIPRPRRETYAPGPIEVRVVLHNNSTPKDGLPACPFLLEGDTVTCSSKLTAGDFTETKTRSFALPAPITLLPGRSATVLVTTPVLQNLIKTPASLEDAWTVNVHIPRISLSKTLKYRIKGTP